MSTELIVIGLVVLAALAYLVWKLVGGSGGSCASCPYRHDCNSVGDRGCPGVPSGIEQAPHNEGDITRG